MKKQISKLSIKTDKVVNLSKNSAQAVVGGRPPQTRIYCATDSCTCTCGYSVIYC